MEIPLTQDKVAIIDDEDCELVLGKFWYAHPGTQTWYARSSDKLLMHHLIMEAQGQIVDHINGNGLDNRRDNLRLATQGQNLANSRKKGNGTTSSKFKGVYFDKGRSKWKARLTKNYREYHIGRFDTEEEAALAYDKTALEMFGEYARTNKMMGLL